MHGRTKQLAIAALVIALLGFGAYAAIVSPSSGAPPVVPQHASGTFTLDYTSTNPSTECDTSYDPTLPACWTCTYNLNVDQATILVDQDVVKEGVRFGPGCTGRIGKLTVITQGGDGIKSMVGAHDIVVGGGSVTCNNPSGSFTTDQYGIRAFGGKRITYAGMYVNCQSSNSRDEFFVNQVPTTQTGAPPSDKPDRILFLQGCLSSGPYSTVLIGDSDHSGVATSTVYPYDPAPPGVITGPTFDTPTSPPGNAGYPAVSPLNFQNTFPSALGTCTSANG